MDIRQQAIDNMKDVFGDDKRRINHALKVLELSEKIIEGEKIEGEDKQIIILTAVLHDIGIHEAERKHNSNSGKFQEIEGPPIAKSILVSMGISDRIIDRVCYIIGGHHTWSKNNGTDFQVIWEADLMVNIQEEGIDVIPVTKALIEKNFKTLTGKRMAETSFH